MKFCPQCGTNFEQGARFCQECGFDAHSVEPEIQENIRQATPEENSVPEVEAIPVKKCRQCNSFMNPEDRFCEHCGADNAHSETELAVSPVVHEPEPPVEVVNDPVTVSQQPPANTGGFCEECGAPMEAESNFCEQCGTNKAQSVVEPVVSEPEPPVEVVNDPVTVSQQPPANTGGFCEECGAPMEAESNFCEQCGTNRAQSVAEPVINEPEPPVEVVNDPVTVSQQPPANTGVFCEECGVPMTEGSIFCEQCGHKNGEETTSDPSPVQEEKVAFTPPPVSPLPPPPAQPRNEKPAEVKPVVPVQQADRKRKRGIVLPVLIVVGVLALGAGGWFAWDTFMNKPGVPVADTTAVAVVPETEIADDLVQEDTIQHTEVPVAEPVVTTPVKENPKPAANRQNTQKKTPPAKKSTEPKKTEPTPQEPEQTNEPVKVKMKPSGSKNGRTILSIHNNDEAKSGPLFASKLKLDKTFVITKITTYHHNWGKGAIPGTILLRKKKEVFGPWQAKGAPGDDGTPNGKWICEPNITLGEGSYKVEVSDEKSWSYNRQSEQKGFVVIEGYESN